MKVKNTFAAPLLMIGVLALLIASRFIGLETLTLQENICLGIIVIELVTLAVPSAFYLQLRGDEFKKKIRIAVFGFDKLLVSVMASVVLILGDILLKLLLYSTGVVSGSYSPYEYYMTGVEPNLLYRLLTFCFLPAILEELLFRGILCAEYEKNGVFTAVLASSLLYGMFSLNIGYFPIYMFIGVILALVMYVTRSLFASMLCHLFFNVTGLIIGDTIWNIIRKPQSTVFLIFALLGAFLLCLVFLLSECERIYQIYSLKNKSSEYAGTFTLGKLLSAVVAPPFLVAMILFILTAVESYI